ncbi:MAG: hypothetical protein AMXMBFR84_05910 [Candidatus Hydrogenedentota bacterium]
MIASEFAKPRPGGVSLDSGQASVRAVEVALTAATLVLLATSIAMSRLGIASTLVVAVNLAAYVSGGYWAARETVPKLLRGELDVDFLMIFAACGAAIIGHWHEGIILLFLFSLSNTLQSFAMDRSRRAITGLLKGNPKEVTVLRDGEETTVPIESLRIGDLMVVRPGQMLATDGVVRRGASDMNEASITGESKLVAKESGSTVFAGAMNTTGALEVEVTRRAEDSTLARMIKMVETAQSQKARSQRALETFEHYYAWIVVVTVTLLILIPWLVLSESFRTSLYRAMVLLVVASPCALVISTPAAILSAIARAARLGILFKGGVYLEKMADTRVVVFDKTGTLTTGKPGVTDLVLARNAPEGFTENDLLAYAAALEMRSEHVLAREIVRAAELRGLEIPPMSEFVALPGRGIHAELHGYEVWIGANRLYEEHGETIPDDLIEAKARLEAEGKSALILHRELMRREGVGVHEQSGGWLGLIAVADTLRGDAKETVDQLRRQGVRRVIMLTGDNEKVANVIAEQSGIDEVHANLLPEDKVRKVAELEEQHGCVMMIGDGVNDAPALANASVGVAMGAAGSDLALESAHCVLMSNELKRVPFALYLSRRAVRTIKVNLAFSMAVIAVLVVTVFAYRLPLPMGVVGHEGSTVLVCLNGLRLLSLRMPHPTRTQS